MDRRSDAHRQRPLAGLRLCWCWWVRLLPCDRAHERSWSHRRSRSAHGRVRTNHVAGDRLCSTPVVGPGEGAAEEANWPDARFQRSVRVWPLWPPVVRPAAHPLRPSRSQSVLPSRSLKGARPTSSRSPAHQRTTGHHPMIQAEGRTQEERADILVAADVGGEAAAGGAFSKRGKQQRPEGDGKEDGPRRTRYHN